MLLVFVLLIAAEGLTYWQIGRRDDRPAVLPRRHEGKRRS
jgi:hypothetical protein